MPEIQLSADEARLITALYEKEGFVGEGGDCFLCDEPRDSEGDCTATDCDRAKLVALIEKLKSELSI